MLVGCGPVFITRRRQQNFRAKTNQNKKKPQPQNTKRKKNKRETTADRRQKQL